MSTEKILDISSLLDIENDEGEEEEQLYTCFEFLHEELEERKEDSELPQFKPSQVWGLSREKTKSQVKFEKGIKTAINSIVQQYPVLNVFQSYPYMPGNIAGTHIPDNVDIRPKMYDRSEGLWLLIDTGAQCSVWPKSKFPQAQIDTSA